MILLICAEGKHGLRVSPGDRRGPVSEAEGLLGVSSEYYPDGYPCFRCGERMEFVPAADPNALRAVEMFDVTPQEAIAAMGGLGLPEERECSAAAIRALLDGAQVKHISTRQIRGSHRCLIDFIEIEDGTKVYLGSSAYGATVYRVVQPSSYVEKLNA